MILHGRTQFAPTNEFEFSVRKQTYKQEFICAKAKAVAPSADGSKAFRRATPPDPALLHLLYRQRLSVMGTPEGTADSTPRGGERIKKRVKTQKKRVKMQKIRVKKE